MLPVILLGGAVAYLMLTKRNAPPITEPGETSSAQGDFSTAVLPTKSKQPQVETTLPIQTNPVASSEMPPYVYETIPDFASFGASEFSPVLEE